MGSKHTLGELNNLSREELITIILGMQGQLDALNENIEKLIEQVRLANQQSFGRHTETMASIEGQLSFFDEADALYKSSYEPWSRFLTGVQGRVPSFPGRLGEDGFPAGGNHHHQQCVCQERRL